MGPHMKNRISVFSFFFLFLFSLSLSAGMVIRDKNVRLDDLTNRAEFVFKGVCEERREVVENRLPLNVYRFKIEEVLKGDLREGESFEVQQLNVSTRREAMEKGVYFLSAERFETGKRYFLFLGTEGRAGIRPIVGGSYGKYEVKKDAEGKEEIENPFGIPESEVKTESKGAGKGGSAEKRGSLKKMGYEEFKGKIKEER